MASTPTKGEKTRDAIIRTAIELFAEIGFDRASFQDIADRCKLSQAAVFYHFANKGELVEAALDSIVQSNHKVVSELVDISDPAEKALMKHFRGNLSWGLLFPKQAQVLILVYYLGCFDSRFSCRYSQMLSTARTRILGYLLAGAREGAFKFRGPPTDVAILLHDALVGSFINTLSTRLAEAKPKTIEKVLQELERRWAQLVAALQ